MAQDTDTPASMPEDSQPQGEGKQVRLRVDERDMTTAYANGFRTNGTPEEVIIDFGLNLPVPQGPAAQQNPPEMVFKVTERVVMNYYSAKRLAITLSQVIRRHEDQYGELELDVNSRRKGD